MAMGMWFCVCELKDHSSYRITVSPAHWSSALYRNIHSYACCMVHSTVTYTRVLVEWNIAMGLWICTAVECSDGSGHCNECFFWEHWWYVHLLRYTEIHVLPWPLPSLHSIETHIIMPTAILHSTDRVQGSSAHCNLCSCRVKYSNGPVNMHCCRVQWWHCTQTHTHMATAITALYRNRHSHTDFYPTLYKHTCECVPL